MKEVDEGIGQKVGDRTIEAGDRMNDEGVIFKQGEPDQAYGVRQEDGTVIPLAQYADKHPYSQELVINDAGDKVTVNFNLLQKFNKEGEKQFDGHEFAEDMTIDVGKGEVVVIEQGSEMKQVNAKWSWIVSAQGMRLGALMEDRIYSVTEAQKFMQESSFKAIKDVNEKLIGQRVGTETIEGDDRMNDSGVLFKTGKLDQAYAIIQEDGKVTAAQDFSHREVHPQKFKINDAGDEAQILLSIDYQLNPDGKIGPKSFLIDEDAEIDVGDEIIEIQKGDIVTPTENPRFHMIISPQGFQRAMITKDRIYSFEQVRELIMQEEVERRSTTQEAQQEEAKANQEKQKGSKKKTDDGAMISQRIAKAVPFEDNPIKITTAAGTPPPDTIFQHFDNLRLAIKHILAGRDPLQVPLEIPEIMDRPDVVIARALVPMRAIVPVAMDEEGGEEATRKMEEEARPEVVKHKPDLRQKVSKSQPQHYQRTKQPHRQLHRKGAVFYTGSSRVTQLESTLYKAEYKTEDARRNAILDSIHVDNAITTKGSVTIYDLSHIQGLEDHALVVKGGREAVEAAFEDQQGALSVCA